MIFSWTEIKLWNCEINHRNKCHHFCVSLIVAGEVLAQSVAIDWIANGGTHKWSGRLFSLIFSFIKSPFAVKRIKGRETENEENVKSIFLKKFIIIIIWAVEEDDL